MKNKYGFVAIMLSVILVLSMGFTNIYVSQRNTEKEEEFVVVTSFYPMYIAAMNVIGGTEGVALKNLSEPQTGCLHDFQLTPEDMKLLSTADVFIINGGGIESFIEDIAKQYPDLQIIEACENLELLCEEEHNHEEESHEHTHEDEHNHDVNAHAWMSVPFYRTQVDNIAKGLAKVDQDHAKDYLANALAYDEKLKGLQASQEELKALAEGEEVIMFHCGFDYIAEEYGMEVAYCMDLDEERQISAGEVAEVVNTVQKHGIRFVFAEKLYGEDMCKTVQHEVDVTVVYLNPLNRGEYNADSYLNGMSSNIALIKAAMEKANK